MIEADAAILPCQHRHLLPPAQVVATRPMGKDDRRALSMHLVVQFNAIYLCFWHMRCPRSSRKFWCEKHLRRAFPLLRPSRSLSRCLLIVYLLPLQNRLLIGIGAGAMA